jgi:hypothetical protein
MIRRIAGWLLVAFLLWWAVREPAQAAHAADGIGRALYVAATGFSRFLSAL